MGLRILPYCLLLASVLSAQSAYRPGYLLQADGSRTGVEILDRDWVDNPRSFQYRLPGEKRAVTAGPEDAAGFGLDDNSQRYERFTVEVDLSDARPGLLSLSTRPEYSSQTVFLSLLVSGAADLYAYEQGELRRFYYRLGDDVPTPLVSRAYRVGASDIRRDDSFRGELRAKVNCDARDARLQQLPYERGALVRYFEEYNNCRGDTAATVYRREPRAGRLSVGLRLGAERGHVVFTDGGSFSAQRELPGEIVPRYGLEVEYRLPFAANRWAVFTGAYFHSIEAERQQRSLPRPYIVNYHALGVPLGVRRYVYLSGRTGVFVNAVLLLDFPTSGFLSTPFRSNDRLLAPSWNAGFDFGGGLSIRDRYQLEVRYGLARGITDRHPDFPTDYTTLAVIATYRIVVPNLLGPP